MKERTVEELIKARDDADALLAPYGMRVRGLTPDFAVIYREDHTFDLPWYIFQRVFEDAKKGRENVR